MNLVEKDDQLLPNLFKDLSDKSINNKRRCDPARFLRELISLAETLQLPAKENFFVNLNKLGILNGIGQLFSCNDCRAHQIAVDIFQRVVENIPLVVRKFVCQEMNRNAAENEEEIPNLVNILIKLMISDVGHNSNIVMQIDEILRILLDFSNVEIRSDETIEFLTLFYRHCMDVLTTPVLANTADESGPSTDNYHTANFLTIILGIITFSVEQYTYIGKDCILTKDLLLKD